MEKKNKHIITILFLLVGAFSNAQYKNSKLTGPSLSTGESIFLHLNTSTFVSGETLFYKVYVLNPEDSTPSQISKVAYIELVDSDKKIISSQKVFLKNGTANSDILIPSALKTGNYKLISHTNWMLNQSKNKFSEQEIFIINPFEALSEKNISKEENVERKNLSQNLENDASFNLSKKSYGTREAVMFSPDLKNISGNYSVSVRRKDMLPLPSQKNATEFIAQQELNSVDLNQTLDAIPEMRGEIISGKITSSEKGNQISNVPVGLSIPGESYVFKIVRTNKNGEFVFTLDKIYSNPKYNIQVISEKRNEYNIGINTKKSVNHSVLSPSDDFKLDASLSEELKNRATASQIESAYYTQKSDTVVKLNEQHFFDNQKVYKLDDYSRFSTLKQTITEVVSEMYYSKSKGKYSFHMRDPLLAKQMEEPTLVLVDGLLVQDATQVAEFNTANVEKITIEPKGYIYGGTVFSGVANISTKERNFDTTNLEESFYQNLENIAPEPEKRYFNQSYSKSKNSTIPDFRYQLLWLPNYSAEKNNGQVSFFTSDITGLFEISIQGFTNEGKPISLTQNFEVK